MALTPFQRSVCKVIAENRIASGESDTDSALDWRWRSDRRLLEEHGFAVRPLRERPTFVEAHVSRDGDAVLLQWVRDSAYRFHPGSIRGALPRIVGT